MSLTTVDRESEYEAFLARKRHVAPAVGLDLPQERLPATLFPFQRDLTHWSLRKGRAALFADTGLGK
ncbi:MAG TPA: helicase, partial [Armatimonadota bacterium]|nr:helicase [Armatimonadota bacterium]